MIDPHLHAVVTLKAVGSKGDEVAELKLATVAGPECPVDLRQAGASFARPLELSLVVYARQIDEEMTGMSAEEAAQASSADYLTIATLVRESWKVKSVSSDFVPMIEYEATLRTSAADLSEHRNLIWEWLFGKPVSCVLHFHQLDMFRHRAVGGRADRTALLVLSRLAVEPDMVVYQIAKQLGRESTDLVQLAARIVEVADGVGAPADGVAVENMIAEAKAGLEAVETATIDELRAMSRGKRLATLKRGDTTALLSLAKRMVRSCNLETTAVLGSRNHMIDRMDWALSDDGGSADAEE